MAKTANRLNILGSPDITRLKGPPGKELGATSQQVGGIAGWAAYVDEMEYVPELTWPASVWTFHKMRSDSQVEALHEGTVQPVREMRWSVDPNRAPAKVVEQAASDLGLPIRGHEDDPIERGPNTFKWDTFLNDALLAMLYGHFHFEIVGDMVGAKEWHMVKLSPRHPRTIADFQADTSGELLGIRQNIGGVTGGWVGLPPAIPVEKLVPFVWRSEAGVHVGRPLLRPIYREWMVKDRVIRIAAINLERAGGVPVIEGPHGASDAQIEDLAEMARQFKVAEGGGGAIPFGSKLTLVGGNVPSAIDLLKYCDECMARVWALMLIQLGTTATGNRALGGEFAIYAARAQRLVATWIKASMDIFLDRYMEWNDPFSTYAPLLHFENSKPDGMSLTDFQALVSVGALKVDPELEGWMRSEYGLPAPPLPVVDPNLGELSPEEVALVQNSRQPPVGPDGQPLMPQKPNTIEDPGSADVTLASGAISRVRNGVTASLTLPPRKLRRDPSPNEIAAAVDFAGMDSTHQEVVNRLHQGWLGEVLPAQIRDLGDQLRTGAKAHALEAPVLGGDLLAKQLRVAAESGVEGALTEMRHQGRVPEMAGLAEKVDEAVREQREAVAQLNANAVALAAQRKAAALSSRLAPDELASAVETHLAGMKHVWEREQLKGATTMAQNTGRVAVMEAQPDADQAVYEASEILDDATCGPCAAIDGTVYGSLDDALADYGTGSYAGCEGGPNCRGTLVAVYPEQNPEGGVGELREAEPAYRQPALV